MRFHHAIVLAAASMLGACGGNLPANGGVGGVGDDTGGDDGGGSAVGDCPGGSTCSPKTPVGLDFAGAAPLLNDFPPYADIDHNHIAVGGVDPIAIEESSQPFDLVFTASSDDPSILSIDGVDGDVVTIRGLGGETELDIVDPATGLLFDRYAYASSPLASAVAFSTSPFVTSPDWLTGSAPAYAFWPGDLSVGIALLDAGESHRLIDTSAVLTLAGATQTRWDQISIPGAVAGSYTVTATIGGGATAIANVDVVDHADDVMQLFSSGGMTCFAAEAAGAFIVGIPWTYMAGGVAIEGDDGGFGPNCIYAPSGTMVTASAGGQELTVTVQ
jgi:hypothetical protein